jgi:histidinol-phosphatase (PHP family)
MLRGAAAKGMSVIALTDHFDIHDQFPAHLSRFDGAGQENSYRILSRLKEHDYGITFLNGIEIGQAHHFRNVAESWLASHEYDYVLASCHIIRGHIDFYHTDYEKNNPDAMLEQYFEELLELCEWGSSGGWFDSLAHLTYPTRYMKGDFSLDRHTDAIDTLFTFMGKNDIALEINTGAGWVVCPELPLVKRFRSLGGRLITIGSDSHHVDKLMAGIDTGIEIAKSAGFSECVYYENRKPKGIKL